VLKKKVIIIESSDSKSLQPRPVLGENLKKLNFQEKKDEPVQIESKSHNIQTMPETLQGKFLFFS
jgi:hypothetical protein